MTWNSHTFHKAKGNGWEPSEVSTWQQQARPTQPSRPGFSADPEGSWTWTASSSSAPARLGARGHPPPSAAGCSRRGPANAQDRAAPCMAGEMSIIRRRKIRKEGNDALRITLRFHSSVCSEWRRPLTNLAGTHFWNFHNHLVDLF